MGLDKKGIFFSIDALIAVAIILSVIIIAYPAVKYTQRSTELHYDVMDVFSSLKIGEVDNQYVKDLISAGAIKDLNKSLLEQIGEFYVTDKPLAMSLADSLLEGLVTNKNVGIWYGSTLIASVNSTPIESAKNIETARQIISGIKEGGSVTGFSARAFLSGSSRSKYSYFGGYVGDGNLTMRIEYQGEISSAKMELAINHDFSLYINGVYSGDYSKSVDEFTPVVYSIPITDFHSGENFIEFKGSGLHVAGGFIRINYDSDAEYEQPIKFYFTGIHGIINLYDGFYIPGAVNSINAFLHFRTNHTVFLNIGDKKIFSTLDFGVKDGQEHTVSLNDSYLSSILNYNALSLKTIPIRFGTENITSNVGPLDIVLVNDRSGSMRQSGWTLNKTVSSNLTILDVTVPRGAYSSSYAFTVPAGVQRVAVELDWGMAPGYPGSEGSEFALNLQRPNGNWIFGSGAPSVGGKVDPPDSVGAANEYFSGISTKPQIVYIENPTSGTWHVRVYGWNLRPKIGPPPSQLVNLSIYYGTSAQLIRNPTILSIEAAKNASKIFVDGMPLSDRGGYVKFGSFAVLAQGLTFNKANVKTAIDNTGLEGGTAIQTGIVSAKNELINNGRQNATKIMIVLTDGQNDAGPQTVINAAQDAKNNGIIIFTVGLTGYVNKDMLSQVASVPSYFYYSQDSSALGEIYDQISKDITAIYREQTLVSQNLSSSDLYSDSYIEFDYTKANAPFGLIATIESQFSNSTYGLYNISSGSTIVESRVVSYSGPRWTTSVRVNNLSVYTLSDYGNDYVLLGDPYSVNIPNSYVNSSNSVVLTTGVSLINTSVGSSSNKIIYTIIKNVTSFSPISPSSEGCFWNIQFEDFNNITAPVPDSYTGANNCHYMPGYSGASAYDENDAFQAAVYKLLKELDLDSDNRVDVQFSQQDLKISLTEITGIPYTWSTEVQVRTWY